MIAALIPLLPEWMGVIAISMLFGLSKRFKRRPLVFQYVRREVWVSLGAFAASAIIVWSALGSSIQQGKLPFFGDRLPELSYSPMQFSLHLWVAVLAVAPFVLALIIRRQPLLSTGLNRQTLSPGLQAGLGMAIAVVFLRGKIYDLINGLRSEQFGYLGGMLVLALAMEFIFRGFIQERLNGWLGERWGWLAAALLSTLWVLPYRLLVPAADAASLAFSLINVGVTALICGFMMRKTNSILAPALFAAFHYWMMAL